MADSNIYKWMDEDVRQLSSMLWPESGVSEPESGWTEHSDGENQSPIETDSEHEDPVNVKDSQSEDHSTRPDTTVVSRSSSLSTGWKNYCFVCGEAQSKIARHFHVHVKDHLEIAEVLSLPVHSKKRKRLLEELRNRGNFMHNNSVLRKGEGTLKVKRRTNSKHNSYEYCPHCKGLFVRPELWRHRSRCRSRPEETIQNTLGRIRDLTKPQQTFISEPEAPDTFTFRRHLQARSPASVTKNAGLAKILKDMRDDELARVVRNDFGLFQFAKMMYNSHRLHGSREELVCQKVHELARFLQALRRSCPSASLEDAMNPELFLKVVQATQETTAPDQRNGQAAEIGQSLLQVSEIFQSHALTAEDAQLRRSVEKFQELHKSRWSECTEPPMWLPGLPDPLARDVLRLKAYLEEKATAALLQLRRTSSQPIFSLLSRLTLARLVLLNTHSARTNSQIPLKSFLQRRELKPAEDLRELRLTACEERLCCSFTRVELPRRRGVLLTADICRAVETLVEKRGQCGVSRRNRFLLASVGGRGCFRAEDCVREFCSACGLTLPDFWRSRALRRHVALVLHFEKSEWAGPEGGGRGVDRLSRLLSVLERGKLEELRTTRLENIRDLTDDDDDNDEEDDGSAVDGDSGDDDSEDGLEKSGSPEPHIKEEKPLSPEKCVTDLQCDVCCSVQDSQGFEKQQTDLDLRSGWTEHSDGENQSPIETDSEREDPVNVKDSQSEDHSTRPDTTVVSRSSSLSTGWKNYCFVCGEAQSKIARHFHVHVKDHLEIAEVLSLPVHSKKRKHLLEELRNRGNFMHNNSVLRKGEGTLKVKRRTNSKHNSYEYCPHCKGLFVRPELWRHRSRCRSRPEETRHECDEELRI